MARGRPELSVVVPTYNEAENLPRLAAGLASHLEPPYELVVVDDASPDGTARVARGLADDHPVRVIEREAKGGLGSAYRAGFQAARGELIVQMDADLSHDPARVPELAAAVRQGAGIALGSRYVDGGAVIGWGPHRRVVSAGANRLAALLLDLPVKDATTGFRCLHRRHRDLVQGTTADGYAFQVEVLHRAAARGVTIREVPITFEDRRYGESKLGLGEMVGFARLLGRLRLER